MSNDTAIDDKSLVRLSSISTQVGITKSRKMVAKKKVRRTVILHEIPVRKESIIRGSAFGGYMLYMICIVDEPYLPDFCLCKERQIQPSKNQPSQLMSRLTIYDVTLNSAKDFPAPVDGCDDSRDALLQNSKEILQNPLALQTWKKFSSNTFES